MTIEELEAGKSWVSTTLEELARDMNVPLQEFEWVQERATNMYDPHSLVCRIRGREVSLAFSYPELCACSRKEVLRVSIKGRIKGFLAACA